MRTLRAQFSFHAAALPCTLTQHPIVPTHAPVKGTHCARCTPLSIRRWPYTLCPLTSALAPLTPPWSVRDTSTSCEARSVVLQVGQGRAWR